MNKPRLEKLIVALEAAKPENFDMGRFARCGTPACVLGHYASRADLQSEFGLEGMTILELATCRRPDCDGEEIQLHFDITGEQACELFDVEGCDDAKTPAEAIAYIRKFIDTNGEMK